MLTSYDVIRVAKISGKTGNSGKQINHFYFFVLIISTKWLGTLEHALLNTQRFQWRHSILEIFILVITLIGLG